MVLAGGENEHADAAKQLKHRINSGEALKRLEEMVKSHGGDLHRKREIGTEHIVESTESGFVHRVNAERLGFAIIEMGGGRKQLGDQLDHSCGIEFLVRIGDKIEKGQPIAKVFCNSSTKAKYACELVLASLGFGSTEIEPPKLIVESL